MKRFSSTMRANSRRTSPTKKRIGLLVIIGLLAFFLWWLIPFAFAQVAALVFTPIEATRTWLFESSGNLPQYLRDRAALMEENSRLQEELAVRGGDQHTVELLQQENDELRSLLGAEGEERVLAAIIGRPGGLPYDVVVIDQGSRDGVVAQAPVYIGDNRVIGRVAKVFFDSAVVELVTTPNLVSSVFIVGPDIYTNAVGLGGGQLRVGVPQGIELELGNSVILPAVSSGVFGTITHIESSPTGPEQYGFVSTDTPLQSLRYVSVGTSPQQRVSFEDAQAIVAEGVTDLFAVPVPEGVLVVTDPAGDTASGTATTSESVSTSTATSTDL